MKGKYRLIATLLILAGWSVQPVSGQQLPDSSFQQSETQKKPPVKEQSIWNHLKINGWVHAQYQLTDTAGAVVLAGGPFAPYSRDRFMLRRGRIKFTYEQGIAQYVLQIDVIDPTLAPVASALPTNANPVAVNVRDFFVKVGIPKTPFALTVGMQNRPFGFELAQSSAVREVPERSRFIQILLPNERDLGAMLTIQAPASSPWNKFKANLGLFNGTGIAREFDSKKDFIGQLMFNQISADKRIEFGLGTSAYLGKVIQTDSNVYSSISVNGDSAAYISTKHVSNIGVYTSRSYIGFDAQFSMTHQLGTTTLRGEYIQGTQPGVVGSSRSPEILPAEATYIRTFQAGYFYFIHQLKQIPVQVVFKYDFYDPNTRVKGTQISSAGKFGSGDVRFDTYGYGVNWIVNTNLKFTLYYDRVKNETVNIAGWGYDRKDNIFTARVQYRF